MTFSRIAVLFMCLTLIPKEGSPPDMQTPCLSKLQVPGYPALSRLAGVQGTVRVKFRLGPACNLVGVPTVLDGPAALQNAVSVAIRTDPGVEFQSCSPEGNTILVSYVFSLHGAPTNEWTPTFIRVTSSYQVEVTTRPGDPQALGLKKQDTSMKRGM